MIDMGWLICASVPCMDPGSVSGRSSGSSCGRNQTNVPLLPLVLMASSCHVEMGWPVLRTPAVLGGEIEGIGRVEVVHRSLA